MKSSITHKVLVVEDEEVVRKIFVKALEDRGYDVVEAVDGKNAMEVWIKEQPDLVLLDILLPEMDGFQLLKTMREYPSEHHRDTPVVVITNLYKRSDVIKASKYSIEQFMVKANHTTEEVMQRIDDVFLRQHQK
ncbi:MAG: response regulator [Candidatus Saccharibacteria bacterium]